MLEIREHQRAAVRVHHDHDGSGSRRVPHQGPGDQHDQPLVAVADEARRVYEGVHHADCEDHEGRYGEAILYADGVRALEECDGEWERVRGINRYTVVSIILFSRFHSTYDSSYLNNFPHILKICGISCALFFEISVIGLSSVIIIFLKIISVI